MTIPSFKKKTIYIITLIVVVLYIIWEKNIQQLISQTGEAIPRNDLYVIIPVLVVLIGLSIRQWIKR